MKSKPRFRLTLQLCRKKRHMNRGENTWCHFQVVEGHRAQCTLVDRSLGIHRSFLFPDMAALPRGAWRSMTLPLLVCTLQSAPDLQPSALPAGCRTSGPCSQPTLLTRHMSLRRLPACSETDVDSSDFCHSVHILLAWVLKNTFNPKPGSCEEHLNLIPNAFSLLRNCWKSVFCFSAVSLNLLLLLLAENCQPYVPLCSLSEFIINLSTNI